MNNTRYSRRLAVRLTGSTWRTASGRQVLIPTGLVNQKALMQVGGSRAKGSTSGSVLPQEAELQGWNGTWPFISYAKSAVLVNFPCGLC